METLNAYLDPIEEDPCSDCAALLALDEPCPACEEAVCAECARLPDDMLCQSCEWVQPCDCCGGRVVFRDLATGALWCRDCALAIDDASRPPTERRRARILRCAHTAVTVAAAAVAVAIEWVAFNPRLDGAGLALHGTLTDVGVLGVAGAVAAYFVGHGAIEHFWPERR